MMKIFILETGVTAKLMINLELILCSQKKLPELQLAVSKMPNNPFTLALQNLIVAAPIFYDVSKLLVCYLMNKIQIDYPISQQKTYKQLNQENFLLANELQRYIYEVVPKYRGNQNWPFFDLLIKTFLVDAFKFKENYERNELKTLQDRDLLNQSLNDIIGKYEEKANTKDDLVRINAYDKAKLPF